jgi:hypothetical protein
VQPDKHRDRPAILSVERLRRKRTAGGWIWHEPGLPDDKGSGRFNTARLGPCGRSMSDAALFDHHVGLGKPRRRDVDAERLGGLQVDGGFELGRKLDRQVGGLGALEDAIDIGRRAPIQIDAVDRSIAESRNSRPLPTNSAAKAQTWCSRRIAYNENIFIIEKHATEFLGTGKRRRDTWNAREFCQQGLRRQVQCFRWR